MSSSSLFSLKWDRHISTFTQILAHLNKTHQYSDATVGCSSVLYPVHKIVLSACSQYFHDIFESTAGKHPVIVLKDVTCDVFEALLSFMYLGQVKVREEKLPDILEAAECLQIKGLAVDDHSNFIPSIDAADVNHVRSAASVVSGAVGGSSHSAKRRLPCAEEKLDENNQEVFSRNKLARRHHSSSPEPSIVFDKSSPASSPSFSPLKRELHEQVLACSSVNHSKEVSDTHSNNKHSTRHSTVRTAAEDSASADDEVISSKDGSSTIADDVFEAVSKEEDVQSNHQEASDGLYGSQWASDSDTGWDDAGSDPVAADTTSSSSCLGDSTAVPAVYIKEELDQSYDDTVTAFPLQGLLSCQLEATRGAAAVGEAAAAAGVSCSSSTVPPVMRSSTITVTRNNRRPVHGHQQDMVLPALPPLAPAAVGLDNVMLSLSGGRNWPSVGRALAGVGGCRLAEPRVSAVAISGKKHAPHEPVVSKLPDFPPTLQPFLLGYISDEQDRQFMESQFINEVVNFLNYEKLNVTEHAGGQSRWWYHAFGRQLYERYPNIQWSSQPRKPGAVPRKRPQAPWTYSMKKISTLRKARRFYFKKKRQEEMEQQMAGGGSAGGDPLARQQQQQLVDHQQQQHHVDQKQQQEDQQQQQQLVDHQQQQQYVDQQQQQEDQQKQEEDQQQQHVDQQQQRVNQPQQQDDQQHQHNLVQESNL